MSSRARRPFCSVWSRARVGGWSALSDAAVAVLRAAGPQRYVTARRDSDGLPGGREAEGSKFRICGVEDVPPLLSIRAGVGKSAVDREQHTIVGPGRGDGLQGPAVLGRGVQPSAEEPCDVYAAVGDRSQSGASQVGDRVGGAVLVGGG